MKIILFICLFILLPSNIGAAKDEDEALGLRTELIIWDEDGSMTTVDVDDSLNIYFDRKLGASA